MQKDFELSIHRNDLAIESRQLGIIFKIKSDVFAFMLKTKWVT